MPLNGPRFRPIRQDIISAARSRRDLALPIADGDYGMLLMFREYQYRTSTERGFSQLESAGSNTTDTIFLPLPANISDTFQIRVQRFDQGVGGEMVSNALSNIDVDDLGLGSLTGAIMTGAMGNLPSIQGQSASEIVNNISRDMAFLVRRGIDTAFPNQGRNIDAGTGTFVNPKAALSFEGVEMKVHSFDWTISPKSAQESEELRLISETIKRNILPQYVNTSIVQRAMFKYPSMVDVFFVGIDAAHYFHFKTCMVQTFSTNYSPNGNSVLRGGRPSTVQMNMTMIESDIHTAEDYGAESGTISDVGDRFLPGPVTGGGAQ